MKSYFIPLLITVSLTAGVGHAVDYKFNGFASIVGGKILSGDGGNTAFPDGRDCPCFVADYNTGALYEDGDLSFKHDTKAGAQINLNFTDDFSFVTQAVARAYSGDVKIEWLYLSWDINSSWTLQAGRKRIPLYYYSEFQDIGLSYQWVRPPQALYGWEASNYNGASLRYSGTLGDFSVRASVYGGDEEVKDAGYNTIYDDDDQDSRWENIRGGDIEVSYEWFTGRFIMMQSENSTTAYPDSGEFFDPPMEQSVMGLALNADFGEWFVLTEFNVNNRDYVRDDYEVKAPASMLGVGWRIGSWTPFISWSRYWDKTDADVDTYAAERFIDTSITLRYDLSASMAIKTQYQQLNDRSLGDFVGDTKVLSVALDMVF